MKLVIAEKPSVSRSIAAVIGATRKQNGYLEGNNYLVSWCVGHLVELAPADAYNKQYKKWNKEDLPIIPSPWQYIISDGTKQQFAILKRLMHDSRVDSIICATDAGREGELIFRLVYSQCGCSKPIQRLWISSMEEAAIKEGFTHLKSGADYDSLYQAALCRAQADWLVGINATRLYSTMYYQTLNIGRVMTPTLSLLACREAQIATFQSASFYHVRLDCGDFFATSERLADLAKAERIRFLCERKEAKIIALETKAKVENPPKLYDLTSLQRDANRLLGFTAQQTLDYTQALYEKKLCTYPRTDSRYLTEHMEESTQALSRKIKERLPFGASFSFSCNTKLVIDGSKVSDHHAIIPTGNINRMTLSMLPAGESSVLTLLMVRLLCAVHEPCRSMETTVVLDCMGVSFFAKGRQIVDKGWNVVDAAYQATMKIQTEERLPLLPPLNKEMTFLPVTASIREGKTTPPKHFTEDTLLRAMETAGVEDTPDDAERKGLGTPATRAAILEKLVKVGFVQRKGSKKNIALLPTEKGMSLITVVPEQIQSPLLTAEWEQKLKLVERGEQSPDDFMAEITEMVRELVRNAQPIKDSHILFADDRKIVGICPRCGSAVIERKIGFTCANRDCRFVLWKENHFFATKRKELTLPIAIALLKEGRVFMKGLYSAKTGKTYDATILLDDTGAKYVNFKIEFGAKKK